MTAQTSPRSRAANKSRMSPRFISEMKTQRDSADLGAGRESVVRDQEKVCGFVPQKRPPSWKLEYFGYYPENAQKYIESLLDSGDYLADSLRKCS